jgi:hypothetical protein
VTCAKWNPVLVAAAVSIHDVAYDLLAAPVMENKEWMDEPLCRSTSISEGGEISEGVEGRRGVGRDTATGKLSSR